MLSEDTALLRAIFCMTARQAFSVDKIREIVGAGDKQHHAFNLCDGTKSQGEIAKAAKIASGNFSNTVSRWIEAGVVIRLGEGRETRLLHAYPIPVSAAKRKSGSK